MFDSEIESGVGLWPGEIPDDDVDLSYELTCRMLADGWVEDDRQVLPEGIEDWLPGPLLAVVVSGVDASRLNGFDLVRLLRVRARLVSHHEAKKLEAVSGVVEVSPCDGEYAALELAASLSLTRRSSEVLAGLAVSLTGRLSRVLEVFSAGLLDMARVRVFDDCLGHLGGDTVDRVLDVVLEEASELTTGQLRARLQRLVLEYDPDGSVSSYGQGLGERKVVAGSNPDHTANLGIFSVPPEDVARARDYIERLARGLKTNAEPRTLDELRADVALDLLQGKHPGLRGVWRGGGGSTHITVSAETLAGLADHPGDLEGFVPVFAEIARKTVRENMDGEWTFSVTDQGRPVATGTLSRRPTVSQKRQIRASYPTCVFPGCRQPSFVCDLDHRRPRHVGGATHNDNLGPLCRHHHMGRHHGYWQYNRLANGDHASRASLELLEFPKETPFLSKGQATSPLGHKYLRKRGPPH